MAAYFPAFASRLAFIVTITCLMERTGCTGSILGPAQRMTVRIFSRIRLIAMHLAGRAKGLRLHKGAVLNAGQRIIMQLLAFRAETASEGVMLLAAVERSSH